MYRSLSSPVCSISDYICLRIRSSDVFRVTFIGVCFIQDYLFSIVDSKPRRVSCDIHWSLEIQLPLLMYVVIIYKIEHVHQAHKEGWFAEVDLLLNIERYATTFFEVDKRLREAAAAMTKSTGHELSLAIAWHSRVLQWSENIHRDLHSDAVLAPTGIDAYWMLYLPSKRPLQSTATNIQRADKRARWKPCDLLRLLQRLR